MRILLIFLFITGSLASPLLFKQKFHPSKLQIRLPHHVRWEGAPLEREEITKLLNMRFSYLGHGSQTYVFVSEDDKVVLKLFRYNRSKFPWLHALKGSCHHKKKDLFLTKIDKTFSAYALAFSLVPDCTELLYLHLNPTHIGLPPTTLIDPSGRSWQLSLENYRFVLQKKASPFKTTLLAALEEGDPTKVEKLLDAFCRLLQKRASRGIRNSDPNLGPNFGFIGEHAVEIDCGNYRYRPGQNGQAEIERFTSQLISWLEERGEGGYAEYLQKSIKLL